MLSVSVSAAETGKRVQASYDRTVGLLSRRRLQEASGEVDSSLAAVSAQQGVDASGQPVTQVLPLDDGSMPVPRASMACASRAESQRARGAAPRATPHTHSRTP